MGEAAFAVALLAAVALFVAWPLFRLDRPQAADEPELSPLERQKHEALTAIKEAEFDYQMRKLTEIDYRKLRDRYSQQAMAAIAALDQAKPAKGNDPIRSTQAAEPHNPRRIAYCAFCGSKVPPRAKFCPACGRALREA